jgi:hypothetical protein
MRATLYSLATWMNNDTGRAVVTHETIARGAGLHRNTVSIHLRGAEEDGWLRCWRHRGPGQDWAITHYKAVIPPDLDLTETKERPETGQASKKGRPVRAGSTPGLGAEDAWKPGSNSLYSINSEESVLPDGAGSSASSPGHGDALLGEARQVSERHHHLASQLTLEERRWVKKAFLGSADYPEEKVSPLMVASLPPEKLAVLEGMVQAREKGEKTT